MHAYTYYLYGFEGMDGGIAAVIVIDVGII